MKRLVLIIVTLLMFQCGWAEDMCLNRKWNVIVNYILGQCCLWMPQE